MRRVSENRQSAQVTTPRALRICRCEGNPFDIHGLEQQRNVDVIPLADGRDLLPKYRNELTGDRVVVGRLFQIVIKLRGQEYPVSSRRLSLIVLGNGKKSNAACLAIVIASSGLPLPSE